MKTVYELNQNELEELRQSYFYQLLETDEDILENIDSPDEIPMENLLDHYKDIYFVDDDFFCNIK